MTKEERAIWADVYRYTDKYLNMPVLNEGKYFKSAALEAGALNRKHNSSLCNALTLAAYDYISKVKTTDNKED